jgi:riboflavin biosynthesis pyrimidine reductase
MRGAEDVSKRLSALYGSDPARVRGVLHAAAAWRDADATLRILRIGPTAPRSETDRFVLRAARMRAQALVTTGKILRDEPDVVHTEHDAALLAWRRECIGLTSPPRSVVLTSGRDLELDHPLLRSAYRPLVVTAADAAIRIRERVRRGAHDIEVVGRRAPDLRDVLALLRERGCETVLVEAGPTTAISLYDEPIAVDELLLSIFEGTSLPEAAIGPAFVAPTRLSAHFAPSVPPRSVDEPSGPWSFSRLVRRARR